MSIYDDPANYSLFIIIWAAIASKLYITIILKILTHCIRPMPYLAMRSNRLLLEFWHPD